MKKFLLTMACMLGLSVAASANVVDVLTVDDLNVAGSTSQSYSTFTVTGESGAEYKLQCAHNKATRLQFRTNNNNSGLVVTKSAGKVVAVTLKWEAETNTTASRKMNIYTSANSYTDPTDLYAANLTAEGSINVNNTTTFTLTNPSDYIGMRSDNGAIYLTKIEIEWETGSTPQPAVAKPEISCTDNKVTITAEEGADIYYTLDTTEPTTASTKYSAPFDITANTTVKAIAVKGADKSSVATFNAVYVGTYANYADLAALGKGAKGTVEGPITGIYKNGRNLYTVDAAGNFMLLFDYNKFADVTDFANGDQFASVYGENSDNYGVPELINVTLGAKTAGTAVQPEVLAVEEISADMLNKYVKIENVKIVAGTSANNYNMTDATGTITLYNTFYNQNNYDVIEVPEGEGFTVTGFVSCYNTTVQITPVLIEGGQTMETVATPTFNPAAGAVKAGTVVEITTATDGAVIFYTTDGNEPGASSTEYTGAITINEDVTIKAIAIKEGMLDSEVVTAAYTILNEDATVATFNFAEPSTLTPAVTTPTADATATDMSNTTLTNNAVSVAFSGQESGTAVPRLWYNANNGIDMRLYKSQSFTVSVAEGFVITGIEFAHYSSKLAGLDCGTVGTYAVNADDAKKAAWTPTTKVADVTFNVTATSQMTTMTVTYEPGVVESVDSIAVESENAPAEYYNLQGVRVDNPTTGLYIVRRGNTVSKILVR